MFVKLIGALLLIASSFSVGVSMSKSLYRRKAFIKSFIVFVDSLETHIRYNTDDIFKLVSMCSDSEELKCFEFFNKPHAEPFDKLWSKSVLTIPRAYALTKSDMDLLLQFGSQLGKTDIDGQIKHIKLYKDFFKKQLDDAEDAIVKKSKLYKTMGLFAGTAAALMMM
ncbi:MAG: stage III sporulation protein AB [Ruminococcus sp.]|nr:stage III sporulation protein AB [Ruminococcus sp.]